MLQKTQRIYGEHIILRNKVFCENCYGDIILGQENAQISRILKDYEQSGVPIDK